jgi:transcriptional regulator with XRE-family HTH domain
MKKPTGCIEHNPTTQSVKFSGEYINLSEISRQVNIHQSVLSHIFAGGRRPSLNSATKISRALGMEIGSFVAALEKHTGISPANLSANPPTKSGTTRTVTTANASGSRSRKKQAGKPPNMATKGEMLAQTKDSESELLSVVKDKQLSYVERGQGVAGLCQSGMEQETIARLASISKEAISKLKICFLNLSGTAREMCISHKMKSDACCSLAHAISKDAGLNHENVMGRAVAISQERDRQREDADGLKGRQTLMGHITNEDIKKALLEEKYKYNRND